MWLPLAAAGATSAAGLVIADATTPQNPLLNFGIVGFVAASLAGVVWFLYRRLAEAHQAELAAKEAQIAQLTEDKRIAEQRGDRLAEELSRVNAAMSQNFLTALADAQRMVAEAIRTQGDRNQGGGR